MRKKKILGDFQTPLPLVEQILERLKIDGVRWERVLEPTCGVGNFLQGLLSEICPPQEIIGIEIQAPYVEQARRLSGVYPHTHLTIIERDLFGINWRDDLSWQTDGELLVIGNPPWVTNAAMGALHGNNLPPKTNFKNLPGLQARTGAANFDIAEYILIKLFHELRETPATIAMLVKTSVARAVLSYAHRKNLPVQEPRLYRIDTPRWFGAMVESCLFVARVGDSVKPFSIPVFANLEETTPLKTMAFEKSRLIADRETHQAVAFLDGESPILWRSGIKHDAASVVELSWQTEGWYNQHGDKVEVESRFIYPLLKGSDLNKAPLPLGKRACLLWQRTLGEDNRQLAKSAPQLWSYLQKYHRIFEARQSSIYKKQPPFSIFGIGEYSFAPYKVLVSGLHKTARFLPVGSWNDKPVMSDDTVYLLPLETAFEAVLVASALNHPLAQQFIGSLVFWDNKRPITQALLKRIHLGKLIAAIPPEDLVNTMVADGATFGLRCDVTSVPELTAQLKQLVWLQPSVHQPLLFSLPE